MMRFIMLIALTLVFSSSASASNDKLPAVAYPPLATSVRHANDFVPRGWKLVAITTGELNGNGRPDVAVLMRMADPRNIKPVTGSHYYKTDDTNPYLLAIGFGRENGFVLATSHHALFPREIAPMHGDDPPGPETVEIRRGVLTSTFGQLRGFDRLHFRWDQHAFTLIGYDCGGLVGDETWSVSANYLTWKARIGKTEIGSDRSKVSVVGLRPRPRPTLDRVNWERDWAGTDDRGASLGC
jgi:hypothetical protein